MKFQNPILNLKQFLIYQVFYDKICKGRLLKKNKMIFFNFSPGNLSLILYKLSKFEAPSCNGF